MARFLLRRLAYAAVTLLTVLTLAFFAIRIVPGDPATVMLGDQASAASIATLRHQLGLDLPLGAQYLQFLKGTVRGDWGVSMVTGQPVTREIRAVLPATLELSFAALLLGVLLGVPVGVWAAVARNRLADHLARAFSLLGLSAPAFVSGIVLLLVFAVDLDWFPVISGGDADTLGGHLRQLTLPVLNLALIMAAYVVRVTRSAMLETLSQDYVRTARAKGLSSFGVIWRHALPNSLIPVITVVGLYLGVLIGNSALTEIVFNRPGLGSLILGALSQRDYPMLQGLLLTYTLIVVIVNLVTDLACDLADPRVRLG